jgi:hypothetical protein
VKKIRLNPGIKTKVSHENSNKPRGMPADVDMISRFIDPKVKLK